MTNIDKVAVEKLFNHFNKKVQKNPNLYAWEKTLHVALPKELKEFANRAGGTSGKGVANGLRVTCEDGFKLRDEVFRSVESLAHFLVTNGGGFNERVARKTKSVGNKHQKAKKDRTLNVKFSVEATNEAAFRVWNSNFTSVELLALSKKFNKLQVENDLKYKTWGEFAKKYDLN